MSVESIALVLHHSRATGTAKLVLLGIANHEGDGGAWPSLATLAKYAGANVRNTRLALRKLEQLGELQTFRQGGGMGGMDDTQRPNLYRVLVACPQDCDGTTRHRTRLEQLNLEGGWAPRKPVDNRGSLATGGVATDRGGEVASDRGGGVASDPLTTHVTNPGTNPGSASSAHARESAACAVVDGQPVVCADGWLGDEDQPSPCPVHRRATAARRRRRAAGGEQL